MKPCLEQPDQCLVTTPRITREAVLAAFKTMPANESASTHQIAGQLGCSEYPVRAAISWLVLGGQLLDAGNVNRVAANGNKYKANLYRYSGHDEIFQVPHNHDDRRRAKERMHINQANDFIYRRR